MASHRQGVFRKKKMCASGDTGSKDIYKFLAEGFTQDGFDIVVPNYRLYPEGRYPTFMEDNALAVAETINRFPNRQVALMGHSAGGYNVLMLGLVPEYLEAAGVNLCEQIAGIAALSAPVGIVPLKEEPLITIFPDCRDRMGLASKPGFHALGLLGRFIQKFIKSNIYGIGCAA